MHINKTKKIGIIGLGVVGGAIHHGFLKIGHQVDIHDIKQETSIDDVLDTELVFLCLPTPPDSTGACDTSITRSVIAELVERKYRGIIVLKSTVEPGTTQSLQKQYPNQRFAHVPEFLRERAATTDFADNHDVCIIGTDSLEDYEVIKTVHGNFPNKFCHVTPLEAELAKYFGNVYNALLITFANGFYEICSKLGADYSSVKNAIVQRDYISDKYLDCNKNLRGFGGVCLPKDTKAIKALCKKLNLDVGIFNAIVEDNEKYDIHVYKGMRK